MIAPFDLVGRIADTGVGPAPLTIEALATARMFHDGARLAGFSL